MTAPASPFQLALPLFEGPIEQLVGMVAAHKLGVLDVPLAEVASQLRAYLDISDETELEQIGEFLAQVAYLLALKSAGILIEPVDEADEPIPAERAPRSGALEAGPWLSEREGAESLASAVPANIPSSPLDPRPPSILQQAWLGMIERLEASSQPLAVPAFVRLEVAISRFIRRLREGLSVSFHRLLKGANRNDATIHFLAVLELVRSGRATASQTGTFEDITIEYREEPEPASIRAG